MILKKLGADVTYHINDRFKEGFGINPSGVEELYKKKVSLIITVDNGIAGIVYGYYEGEDFYYLDRLDVDVSKKEELRKMNVMELRQEIALKIKIFVANSN